MKILVTGSKGQLGSELKFLIGNNQEWDFCDRQKFDLANTVQMRKYLDQGQPDIIVNCAAYTAVDKAEEDKDTCYLINRDAVKDLGALCKEKGIKLIHISSDYVYHTDQNTALDENDPTEPKGIYAKSKREGELAILDSECAFLIIRTSWVYSVFGNNFIKTVIRLAQDRELMSVVNDQIGAPTNARDLAQAIIDIIQKGDNEGWNDIYNYVNTGQTNWSGIAQYIVDHKSLSMSIKPIPSSEYPTPAQRPKWSVLSTEKIRKAFKLKIRPWTESLEECLAEL